MTSRRTNVAKKTTTARAPSSREIVRSRNNSASSVVSTCSSNKSSVDVGLESPILGKNFKIPDLYSELKDIELDDSSPYIPVYCHFVVPEIEPIIRPNTPPTLLRLRAELGELQLAKTPSTIRTKSEQKSRNTHHSRQSNKNHSPHSATK